MPSLLAASSTMDGLAASARPRGSPGRSLPRMAACSGNPSSCNSGRFTTGLARESGGHGKAHSDPRGLYRNDPDATYSEGASPEESCASMDPNESVLEDARSLNRVAASDLRIHGSPCRLWASARGKGTMAGELELRVHGIGDHNALRRARKSQVDPRRLLRDGHCTRLPIHLSTWFGL